MGWKEFAASVIGSVAWPVVVIAVVVMLLGPIRRLIGRIRTWKGFGVEAELEEDLQAARKQAGNASTKPSKRGKAVSAAEPGSEATPNTTDDSPSDEPEEAIRAEESPSDKTMTVTGVMSIAEWQQLYGSPAPGEFPPIERAISAPVLAISESWHALGMAISKVTAEHRGPVAPMRNLVSMVDYLSSADLVNESFVGAVLRLYKIRNEVLTGEVNPMPEEALDYRRTAMKLHRIVSKLMRKTDPQPAKDDL